MKKVYQFYTSNFYKKGQRMFRNLAVASLVITSTVLAQPHGQAYVILTPEQIKSFFDLGVPTLENDWKSVHAKKLFQKIENLKKIAMNANKASASVQDFFQDKFGQSPRLAPEALDYIMRNMLKKKNMMGVKNHRIHKFWGHDDLKFIPWDRVTNYVGQAIEKDGLFSCLFIGRFSKTKKTPRTFRATIVNLSPDQLVFQADNS